MTDIEPVFLNLAVALGIGLLIGAERERRKGSGPSRSPAGIRTFAIASLAGAISLLVGGETLLAIVTAGIPVMGHIGLTPQSISKFGGMRAQGKTVLLTTHFMEEAERLCDRVAILDHGRIVALDTPAALIRNLGVEERVVFNLDGTLPAGFEKALSEAARLEVQGERVVVHGKNGRRVPLVSEVVSLLAEQGVAFRDLRTERHDLV